MSQFRKETKEHFKKIQKSPCQECGECQGILQNRMQKLASSNVIDSYAGLTVKMLNPNGRRTTGMADSAYLAWSHLSVTYQRSQHSHLCQPASPAPLSTDMPTHNPDTV